MERLCVYLKELSTEEEILRTERKDHTYSPAPYPAEACAKDVYQMQKDSSTITFRFRELTLTSKMVFFFCSENYYSPKTISKEQEEISISDAML